MFGARVVVGVGLGANGTSVVTDLVTGDGSVAVSNGTVVFKKLVFRVLVTNGRRRLVRNAILRVYLKVVDSLTTGADVDVVVDGNVRWCRRSLYDDYQARLSLGRCVRDRLASRCSDR